MSKAVSIAAASSSSQSKNRLPRPSWSRCRHSLTGLDSGEYERNATKARPSWAARSATADARKHGAPSCTTMRSYLNSLHNEKIKCFTRLAAITTPAAFNFVVTFFLSNSLVSAALRQVFDNSARLLSTTDGNSGRSTQCVRTLLSVCLRAFVFSRIEYIRHSVLERFVRFESNKPVGVRASTEISSR